MKKKLILLIVVTIAIIVFVLIKAVNIQKNSKTIWKTSGYILNSEISEYSTDSVEKYYFNADSEYKLRYDDTLAFKNTNKEEIVVDSNIFVHYSDESISSFSKGVILNLADLEKDPILYYNFAENNIIQKAKNNYSIYTINGEIKLTDFIYKISSDKYIVVSNEFEIEFSDGTKRKVSGYLELEYMDNEVVKLYNDTFFYQTVDTNLKLNLKKNVLIDLEAKVVSKDGSKKLTLDNMVINSNDNINSIDLDKYKDLNELAEEERLAKEAEEKLKQEEEEKKLKEEEKAKAEAEAKRQANAQTQTINDSTYNQSTTTIVGGQQGINISNNDNSNTEIENQEEISANETEENNQSTYTEEVVEQDLSINMPKFGVVKFESDAVSMHATIEVSDEDNLLSKDYIVNIYKNSTGKSVFSTTETLGTYSFDLAVTTLEPDTYYTLSIEAGYTVDDIQYSKAFVYKIFKTDVLGIDISKNYFTDKSMNFNVDINEKTKVQSAVLQLTGANGEVIASQTINNETTEVNFVGLQHNTKYNVNISNVFYDNQVIENFSSMVKEYETLKEKPTLGQVDYTIDKKESEFVLSLNGTQDLDNSIQSYRYEVYSLTSETPIVVSESEKNESLKIKVDDTLIFRDIEYYFKVIITTFDNEKYVEYESSISSVMIMDSAEFPTVEFEKEEVTFEKISGIIKITDNYGTINLNENLTVVYSDSVGETNSFSTFGSLTIPFNVNNLRSNETYKVSLYGQVDLQDENGPIENCYIGSFTVKTELPKNLVASLLQNSTVNSSAFAVEFQLNNSEGVTRTLEAQTLTGMTLSIYPGATATGVPKKVMPLVDTNTKEYESTLMDNYYSKSAIITPETFGLKNSDFTDKTYTLVVSEGYDYTTYKNEIPILNNQIVVKTTGFMPDLPSDTEDTMQVDVIRNRDSATYDENLNPETIVGYKVRPYFSNTDGYAKKVTYQLRDITGKVLDTKILDVDGVILPDFEFDVKYGTYYTENDSILGYMVRGNEYYFSYVLDMDLDDDGIIDGQYPYDVNGNSVILKSKSVKIPKQRPDILLYPSKSTDNSIEYKYKITDIDNALIKDVDNDGTQTNVMMYINNNSSVSSKSITINSIDSNQFNSITFNNIEKGNINIYVSQSLQKKNGISKRELINQYYEGIISVSDLRYSVTKYTNFLDIELIGDSDILTRISSVDVKFKVENTDEEINLENQSMANNIITIPYNKIADLCGKDLTVIVEVWFDDGLFGYDMDSENYSFQKSSDSNAQLVYYNVKNRSITTQNDTWNLKYIISSFSNGIMNLKNILTNNTSEWELNLTENGYLYNYDIILPKEIMKSEIACSGSNSIKFEKVIPSISLLHTRRRRNLFLF